MKERGEQRGNIWEINDKELFRFDKDMSLHIQKAQVSNDNRQLWPVNKSGLKKRKVLRLFSPKRKAAGYDAKNQAILYTAHL